MQAIEIPFHLVCHKPCLHNPSKFPFLETISKFGNTFLKKISIFGILSKITLPEIFLFWKSFPNLEVT